MTTHEQIRARVAKMNGYTLGCDSGQHMNVGRCSCEGGRWEEETLDDGSVIWAFYTFAGTDPCYVMDAPRKKWWRR